MAVNIVFSVYNYIHGLKANNNYGQREAVNKAHQRIIIPILLAISGIELTLAKEKSNFEKWLEARALLTLAQ